MKRQDLINLIRAHYDGDEDAFRRLSNAFANDFYDSGEQELGRAIAALTSETAAFVPQSSAESCASFSSPYFTRVSASEIERCSVFWPDAIYADVVGIANAIKRRNGISKFLFHGKPGTGKTETAKVLAGITKCELWSIDFSALLDYRLGETIKNINDLFKQISIARNRRRLIFLFDEIDSIALNRVDQNDLREMGRATSAFLKGMDSLPEDVCLIATTNLFEKMDPALIRRFDFAVDFSRYSREDRIDVGVSIYNAMVQQYPDLSADSRLFKKILEQCSDVPYPGDLKNLLKTAIAFGGDSETQYLSLFYRKLVGKGEISEAQLARDGFTLRQIAVLTESSKSSVSRRLSKDE